MKFVLAGLGFWGQTWTTLLLNHPQAELVAVIDPTESAAKWAQDNLKVPHFSALHEALGRLEFDAVLVATPPGTHAAVTVEALNNGKHVLLEKPLAATIEDAIAIEQAAAESLGRVMVGQGYRFLDGAKKIRELIETGTIGTLNNIRIRFRQSIPTLFSDRRDHPLYSLNHSILIDMSVHHFDLVRYLTRQEIIAVSAIEYQTPENMMKYPSAAVCVLKLQNDLKVLWDGDFCVYEELTCWEGEWELIGNDARLFWRGDFDGSKFISSIWTQKPKEARVRLEFTETVIERRQPVLEHFISAINNGEQPQPSVKDNIRTLGAVFGAVDSIEKGVQVELM
jgi:predicted dehydrogenase